MAFDFNSKQTPSRESGNPADSGSARGFGRDRSGFGNGSSDGNSSGGSGFGNGSSSPRSSGFSTAPRPSGGFSNRPSYSEPAERSSYSHHSAGYSDRHSESRRPVRLPKVRKERGSMFDGMSLSGNKLLLILAGLAVVFICWLLRDAISSFLSQVLSWVIIILIIIVIIKWFIFPRRRR